MRDEFLALRQGLMTVAEYAHRYSRLFALAGSPLPSHDFRSRFIRGLREDIGKVIGSSGVTEFSLLVDRAREYESTERFCDILSPVQPTQLGLIGSTDRTRSVRVPGPCST